MKKHEKMIMNETQIRGGEEEEAMAINGDGCGEKRMMRSCREEEEERC